jgi:hypothetical protein
MLSTKFCVTQSSVAKVCPQPALGFSLIMTQPTGVISRCWVPWLGDDFPLTLPSPPVGARVSGDMATQAMSSPVRLPRGPARRSSP